MAEDYIKDPVVEFDCDGQNPYETLGLEKYVPAKPEEIKKAYRKMSLKYHPDKQSRKTDDEKKEAEAQFKIVNNAYDILMKHQDRFRKECSQQEQQQQQWREQQQEQWQQQQQQQQQQQWQQQWREQQQQQWQQQQQGQSEQERGRSRYRGQEQDDPLFAEENAEEQRERLQREAEERDQRMREREQEREQQMREQEQARMEEQRRAEEAEIPYYQFKEWCRVRNNTINMVNWKIDDVYIRNGVKQSEIPPFVITEKDFNLIVNVWNSNPGNLEDINETIYDNPTLIKLYELYRLWIKYHDTPRDNDRRARSKPRYRLITPEGLDKYLKNKNKGMNLASWLIGSKGGIKKSVKRKKSGKSKLNKGTKRRNIAVKKGTKRGAKCGTKNGNRVVKKGKKRNSKKYGKK